MSLRLWMTGTLAGLLGLVSLAAPAQTVRYIHTDALGSPVAVTNASRTVIERSEYEPYGQVVNRPLKAGPGYTGHVMDASTGLAYMQQRYYDPELGRLISVDPIAADAGTGDNFNRYKYAMNNPYRFTDPDGRQPVQGGSHPTEDAEEQERIRQEQERRAKRARLDAASDRFAGIGGGNPAAFRAYSGYVSVLGQASSISINAPAPDYIHGAGGVYIISGDAILTRNGSLFAGGSVIHGLPSAMVNGRAGGAFTLGFMLSNVQGSEVDAFVRGASTGFTLCYYVCAGYTYNSGGRAIEIGVGTPGAQMQAVQYMRPITQDLPGWER